MRENVCNDKINIKKNSQQQKISNQQKKCRKIKQFKIKIHFEYGFGWYTIAGKICFKLGVKFFVASQIRISHENAGLFFNEI